MKSLSNPYIELKRHCVSDSPIENAKNVGFALFSLCMSPLMAVHTLLLFCVIYRERKLRPVPVRAIKYKKLH